MAIASDSDFSWLQKLLLRVSLPASASSEPKAPMLCPVAEGVMEIIAVRVRNIGTTDLC